MPIEARFWRHVAKAGERDCWLWQASVFGHGYGQFMLGGRPIQAHRVAWELIRGPIPDGLFICHHCDVPRCCNPAHLYVGTQRRNLRDAGDRARFVGRMGRGRRLTVEQQAEVRRRHEAGERFRALGAAFGVSRETVRRVARGKYPLLMWRCRGGDCTARFSFDPRRPCPRCGTRAPDEYPKPVGVI